MSLSYIALELLSNHYIVIIFISPTVHSTVVVVCDDVTDFHPVTRSTT